MGLGCRHIAILRNAADGIRSKRLGVVSGRSDSPQTCAPMRASQTESHPPLKPVCPVSRTR